MSRKTAILITLLGLATLSFAAEKPRPVRLLFTGDILLSRQVRAELRQRQASPWQEFAPLFRSADWVAGNLEGAVGVADDCLPRDRNFCFDIPDALLDLLPAAGFRAVSLANNHAGDLGRGGRENTRRAVAARDLQPLDFAGSPQFLRFGDITVAVIALSTVRAADGEAQTIPSVAVEQKLRYARGLANAVLVSVHWGSELLDWPGQEQRAQAEWLVAHGADAIFGHHAHVVQAPECVHGRPVFFSLGNHLFDQKYPETKKGLIADCRLAEGELSCGGIGTHTAPNTSIPRLAMAPDGAADALRSCRVPLHPTAELAGVSLRPRPGPTDPAGRGVVLEGWRAGQLAWASRRQEVVSLQVGPLDGPGRPPLLFTLERHYSPIDQEEGIRPYVYAVGPRGLIARWRGSALAWPLLDAVIEPRTGVLCAMHRADSFLTLQPESKGTRVAAYRWNGFGFRGVEDRETTRTCEKLLPR